MSCPLGRYSQAALAAANAGIRRYIEVPAVTDPAGLPARACRLASLSDDDPYARAIFFARDALSEALMPVARCSGRAIPVFVATPPAALSPLGQDTLLAALREVAPAHFDLHWVASSITSDGRAGGASALAAALMALDSVPQVLVGGLDSQASGTALQSLADTNRLLGERNCDGRLPGEGAAFLLLGRPGLYSAPVPLGAIHALARAQDPRAFLQAQAGRAEGLSQVFASLRRAWPTRVDEIVTAQSAERYWGSELAMAYLRNVELMPEPMRTRQVANALGDCGAAAFPIGLLFALLDFRSRLTSQGPIRSALVYASSDTGLVGGTIMSADVAASADAAH